MRPEDLLVEVRDSGMNRVGVITKEFLQLECQGIFNGIGTWKLELPLTHHAAEALSSPGSGIVVTGPTGDAMFSGPMTAVEEAYSPEDITGTLVVEGESDDTHIADRLCWPDPLNSNVNAKTIARDSITAPVETVMHYYVNRNLGPGAVPSRMNSYVQMGEDFARGDSITKKARHTPLIELLTEVAKVAGLGFRLIDRAGSLVFETYEPMDLSSDVRLRRGSPGGISGMRSVTTAPDATRIIVGGGGQGTAREFLNASSDASVAAEEQWGRRREVFVDQRQTSVAAELQEAANEVLVEGGYTTTAVQLIPSEAADGEFGVDWGLGDLISVELAGREIAIPVTRFVLKANEDGVRLGIGMGDDLMFLTKGRKRISRKEVRRRLGRIERND